MTAPQGPNPPAWHPDPERPGMLRWWDGERWTDHRQPVTPTAQITGGPASGPPFVTPPQQGGGVPKWLLIGGPIVVLLLVIGVVVAVAVSSGDDDDDVTTGPTTSTGVSTTDEETTTTDEETTTTDEETTTTDEETTTTVASGKGSTREDPLAIGEAAEVGDYTVTLTQFIPDATMMMTADGFNDPPSNGLYGVVNLAVTYTGDTEGDPSFELTVTLSGSDAVQYVDFDCAALPPDPGLFDAPTLESGGMAGGNVCLDYPAAALPGTVFFIESTNEDFETSRRYWATS
jgi:hypothetical protein